MDKLALPSARLPSQASGGRLAVAKLTIRIDNSKYIINNVRLTYLKNILVGYCVGNVCSYTEAMVVKNLTRSSTSVLLKNGVEVFFTSGYPFGVYNPIVGKVFAIRSSPFRSARRNLNLWIEHAHKGHLVEDVTKEMVLSLVEHFLPGL